VPVRIGVFVEHNKDGFDQHVEQRPPFRTTSSSAGHSVRRSTSQTHGIHRTTHGHTFAKENGATQGKDEAS
jgi:hypothetical protein